jgi:hypothetical protein
MILVGEERERQVVLVGETLLAGLVEDAHAEHGSLAGLETGQPVSKRTRLLRAAGRVVLRIEVEHDRSAGVVGQPPDLALLIVQAESWRSLSGFDDRHECTTWEKPVKRFVLDMPE